MKGMNKLIANFVGALSAVAFSAIGMASLASASELVNLVTKQPGMHRISYQQLVDQGADLRGVSHRRFGLTINDEPVAIRTQGQDRSVGRRSEFGPGGFIEFYATGSDNLYTDSQAFTLHLLSNDQRHLRVNIPAVKTRFDKTAPTVDLYDLTVIIEENTFYDTIAPPGNDPWHAGQSLSLFPTPTYNFTLSNVAGGSAQAAVEVEMYGLLDFGIEGNDHHYTALLNGAEIGDQQFDGNTITTLVVDDVTINEGNNTFKYEYRPVAGVAFDRIAWNRLKVTYPSPTLANDGYLQGYFAAEQAVVSGAGTTKANVYRKNSDGTIERLIGTALVGTNTAFSTGGVAAEYIVVADGSYRPVAVAPINDDQDISTGEAEYLVIAHSSLIGPALSELVQIRQQQYSVKVVDVSQVFGQFGNHLPGADAIKAYVKHAAENMQTKLVLLVGTDTFDTKGYISDAVSMVPTLYVSTPGGAVTVTQTPSDAAYGDTDDSGVPNIAVGRIPARTEGELANVVEKIRDYRAREGYVGRVLIAADKDDVGKGISFSDDAQDLIDAMPSEWGGSIRSDFRAYPDVDGAEQAREKLITAMNAGVSVVSYIGHSSQQSWSYASPPIFTANQVTALTNIDKPTLVTQWGCWNTYFVDPAGNSMADRFLTGGETGAVAVLGASTLTNSNEERALGVELNKRMFARGVTIGEALVAAKQALADQAEAPAVQYGLQILGDPAIMVVPGP